MLRGTRAGKKLSRPDFEIPPPPSLLLRVTPVCIDECVGTGRRRRRRDEEGPLWVFFVKKAALHTRADSVVPFCLSVCALIHQRCHTAWEQGKGEEGSRESEMPPQHKEGKIQI